MDIGLICFWIISSRGSKPTRKERAMITEETPLEENWKYWRQRYIEGKVKGDFPEAEELLDERKNEVVS